MVGIIAWAGAWNTDGAEGAELVMTRGGQWTGGDGHVEPQHGFGMDPSIDGSIPDHAAALVTHSWRDSQ
jgi:hypothetical protein